MAASEPDNGAYLRELSGALTREHFETVFKDDGLLTVTMGGEALCIVTPNSGVRHVPEAVFIEDREAARECVSKLADVISEYMGNLKSALWLRATGLEDYHLLAASLRGIILITVSVLCP